MHLIIGANVIVEVRLHYTTRNFCADLGVFVEERQLEVIIQGELKLLVWVFIIQKPVTVVYKVSFDVLVCSYVLDLKL